MVFFIKKFRFLCTKGTSDLFNAHQEVVAADRERETRTVHNTREVHPHREASQDISTGVRELDRWSAGVLWQWSQWRN
jgi:hypothetical protein